MADTAPLSASEIRAARKEYPKLRARDLADQLGISEAELVAADIGRGVTRINPHPDAIVAQAERLGEVMALTRMPACVHEKVGEYANYHAGPHASMVLNDAIDLRIFPSHWAHAFAVEIAGDDGPRRSLQVFDAAGDAVHKIHLRTGSKHDIWENVVSELALDDMSDVLTVAERRPPSPPQARSDKAADLDREWDAMTDTHQFVTLVRRLKMNRLGAYRTASAPRVRRLAVGAVVALLDRLAETGVPVMIFVGNHGCIQIHSGRLENLKPIGPWINVMDPGFNLHLRGDRIAEVWEVNKPTKRGMATSVEAFDEEGGLILQIFGMRAKNAADADAFEALVRALPAQDEEVPA